MNVIDNISNENSENKMLEHTKLEETDVMNEREMQENHSQNEGVEMQETTENQRDGPDEPEELTDDIEEGKLYKCQNGELVELEIDPEDNMRKIRVTEDAVYAVTGLQKNLRKVLGGYKPDISIVSSALLKHAAEQADSQEVVKKYVIEKWQS